MNFTNRLATRAAAVVAAGMTTLWLAGCANPHGIGPWAAPLQPSRLGLEDDGNVERAGGAGGTEWPQSDWWRAFGDEQLDALVDRALADSPGLRLAQARLALADAAADSAGANAMPRLDASADSTRQHISRNAIYPPPIGGATLTLNNLQLAGSWEIDFFGRHREAFEAALGQRRSAQAEQQSATVLLASRVVTAYVALAGQLAQREVAQRALERRQEVNALVRQRVHAGLDSNVELRQSEGQVPESRQQIEAIDEQITATRHALAALTVQPPDALVGLAPELRTLHLVQVPPEVPADLLGRRADVTAARWRVEAAAAGFREARTLFYPNVNLTAFVGLSSAGFDKFLQGGSRQWGVGPAVRLPIFDAGRLRANLRGRAAEVDAAIESYNDVVIQAVRDAADRINAVRSVERQVEVQRAADQAAESAYALSRDRYRAGLTTFLVVLNAEASLLRQRQLATDLHTRQLDTQVALVHALGGGYLDSDSGLGGAPLAAIDTKQAQ